MERQPAVAGQFYPADPAKLRAELDRFVVPGEKRRAIGVVSPHAGYIYSGAVAGKLFGAVRVPRTVLLIGPNHHGIGAAAALFPSGRWLSPLGPVPVEERLSQSILKQVSGVAEDPAAHRFEHSIEVQIPFLQHQNPEVSIAALSLGFLDYGSCRLLGEGIARAVTEFAEEVLMVASSDMTHYESADSAKLKDALALKEIERLDPESLLAVCREKRISMCGAIPATVMLVAAKALGASTSELVCYASSGEVNGDLQKVVGYASVAVY